jgi:S-adenosylmethionine hydrolase
MASWALSRQPRRKPSLVSMVVCFLSDFGLQDDFVGTCHGVIARIAPSVRVIDVTHGIPPQAILQGALVLANTLPFMPVGVHLAVVDPGVGGIRRSVALRDNTGRLFVGPDNGLLLPAAERAGIAEVVEIANPAYALEAISRTFHGRDLFAPAAAHLATGIALGELGPSLASDTLARLELPVPVFTADGVLATMLYVDSFGNIALNLTQDDIARIGVALGARVELDVLGRRYYAVAARTFADAGAGEVILYEDSYGSMSVAVSRGSAATTLHASSGTQVRLRPA